MNGIQICNALNKKASNGAELRELLSEAVRLLHESNERFHWTGIYELLPGNILQLGPFIGAPTDHVVIAVGNGVCGSAVADRCNKNIPDVTKESNYLACSKATRSELVVLVQKDGMIFGQVDIDSHDVDAFDARATTDVQNVADWLAEAYAARAAAIS